jgi:hypothetical protein
MPWLLQGRGSPQFVLFGQPSIQVDSWAMPSRYSSKQVRTQDSHHQYGGIGNTVCRTGHAPNEDRGALNEDGGALPGAMPAKRPRTPERAAEPSALDRAVQMGAKRGNSREDSLAAAALMSMCEDSSGEGPFCVEDWGDCASSRDSGLATGSGQRRVTHAAEVRAHAHLAWCFPPASSGLGSFVVCSTASGGRLNVTDESRTHVAGSNAHKSKACSVYRSEQQSRR